MAVVAYTSSDDGVLNRMLAVGAEAAFPKGDLRALLDYLEGLL